MQDVTIVIAGDNRGTQDVINHFRNWFSGEIIFSTFDNIDTSHISRCDQIVKSPDPGTGPGMGNAKRQCVSAISGIQAAKNDMILRIRPDTYLTSMPQMPEYTKTDLGMKFLEDRVLVCGCGTVDPRHTDWNRAFGLSDWVCFGHKKDIIRMHDMIEFLEENKNGCCEQIMLRSSIQKYLGKHIPLIHDRDMDEEKKEMTFRTFVDNFLIENFREKYGMVNKKYGWNEKQDIYITHEKWLELYRKYTNG